MKHKMRLLLLSILLISSMLVGCNSKEAYRVIKVNSFEGETSMNRAEEAVELFEGIQLVSNDKVTTGSDGLVELLVDSDKTIAASADTCFAIEAVGDETQGKVTIHLEYGTTSIEIQNKLTDGSEFEVVTPNATLSVRGTTFEVTYDAATNETTVSVTDGVVEATTNIESREINAGETVVIQDVNIIDEGEADATAGDASIEHDPSTDDFAHTEDIMATLVSPYGASLSIKQIEGFEEENTFQTRDDAKTYICEEYSFFYSIAYGNALNERDEAVDFYMSESEQGRKLETEVNEYINDDGETIYCYHFREEYEGNYYMTSSILFKQLDDEHYMTIDIGGVQEDGTDVYEWVNPEDYLDLTKECYYVFE